MTTTTVTYRRVQLAVFDADTLRAGSVQIQPRRACVVLPEVVGSGSPWINIEGPVVRIGDGELTDSWRGITVVSTCHGEPDLALADAPQWVRDVWAEHVPAGGES